MKEAQTRLFFLRGARLFGTSNKQEKIVKHILLSLSLIILSLNCSADQQVISDTEAEIAGAKTTIKQYAAALQTELKTAMQTGGPVAAIGVCNTQAMPITAQVAAEHGIQLSRVSLKNRSPANVPNEWQTAVLQDFNRQQAAGKDITKLAWSETVNTDSGREFRFMKAIPTAEVCLKCHGSQLAPEVSQVLSDIYPEDKATGYSVGDIRGAFVLTRKIE